MRYRKVLFKLRLVTRWSLSLPLTREVGSLRVFKASPKLRVVSLNVSASSRINPDVASLHCPFSLPRTSDKYHSDCWAAFWHC